MDALNVRVLKTFFLKGNVWATANLDLKKKRSSRQNNSKYCSLSSRKCKKLPQTCGFAVEEHLLQFGGIFDCGIECEIALPGSAN